MYLVKNILYIMIGLSFLFTMPAYAGGRHHHSSSISGHHHVRHHHHQRHVEPRSSLNFSTPFAFFQQPTQNTQTAHTGSGRPSGCPHAWCGCWMRMQKGLSDAALNLAANWRHWGHQTSYGCVGCVAVMRHHVGQVQGYDARGNIILLSGNHGHRVGIGTYSRSRIIAYRN